jgi:hypothetical protein
MSSSHRVEVASASNIMFSSLQGGLLGGGPFSDFPPFGKREESLLGEGGEASAAAPQADNNLTRGDVAVADNDLNNSVVGEEDSEEEKEEIDDEAKVRFFYQSCDLDPDPDPAFHVNPDLDTDTDTDPIRIQGFDDQKLKEKNAAEIFFLSFF